MTNFNYALPNDDYSWKNALLWGNFNGHLQKAMEGTLGDRIIHVLIAAIEFLPIIGQIASIFEKIIVSSFSNFEKSEVSSNLSEENATVLSDKQKNVDELTDEKEKNSIVNLQGKLFEIEEKKRKLTEEYKIDSNQKEIMTKYQEAKNTYERFVEDGNSLKVQTAKINMDFLEPDRRSKQLATDFENQLKKLNNDTRSAFEQFNTIALIWNYPSRIATLDSYRAEYPNFVPKG